MAQQHIVVGEGGIESVAMVLKSVADGIAAGQLTARTSLALRLLHESAKAESVQPGVSTAQPISFFDSVGGTFLFRCACGRRFYGPWEEARAEAIGHIELRHADQALKKNLDALEAVIAALILPNPLNSWEQLSYPDDPTRYHGD